MHGLGTASFAHLTITCTQSHTTPLHTTLALCTLPLPCQHIVSGGGGLVHAGRCTLDRSQGHCVVGHACRSCQSAGGSWEMMAAEFAYVVGTVICHSCGAAWSFLAWASKCVMLVVAVWQPVLETEQEQFGAWTQSAQADTVQNNVPWNGGPIVRAGLLVQCRLFDWRDVLLVPLHYGYTLDGRRKMLTEPWEGGC